MTSISPVAYVRVPQVATVAATAPTDARRRAVAAASHATAGVAELRAPEQQLPFSARVGVGVSVRGRLLFPIVGAVLGTLLLGLPGTFIGAGVGFLLA